MNIKSRKTTKKDRRIDSDVIAQARDSEGWEAEENITPKTVPTSIRLSTRTIERAKFFARVHHARGYQTWLKSIIEERIRSEYEVYRSLKRDAG